MTSKLPITLDEIERIRDYFGFDRFQAIYNATGEFGVIFYDPKKEVPWQPIFDMITDKASRPPKAGFLFPSSKQVAIDW